MFRTVSDCLACEAAIWLSGLVCRGRLQQRLEMLRPFRNPFGVPFSRAEELNSLSHGAVHLTRRWDGERAGEIDEVTSQRQIMSQNESRSLLRESTGQTGGNVKSMRNEADSTWHALWVSFQLLKRRLANSISLGFRCRSWPLVWILFGAVRLFHYELYTVTSGHNKSELCATHSFISLEYTLIFVQVPLPYLLYVVCHCNTSELRP